MCEESINKSSSSQSIGQLLKNEVAQICSDKFQSLTRSKEKEHFQDLNDVKKFLRNEMEKKTPVLFSLLTASLRTRIPRMNNDVILIVIFSIICKHRRKVSCLLQSIESWCCIQDIQASKYAIFLSVSS